MATHDTVQQSEGSRWAAAESERKQEEDSRRAATALLKKEMRAKEAEAREEAKAREEESKVREEAKAREAKVKEARMGARYVQQQYGQQAQQYGQQAQQYGQQAQPGMYGMPPVVPETQQQGWTVRQQVAVERRWENGGWYTLQEFVNQLGPVQGQNRWQVAPRWQGR